MRGTISTSKPSLVEMRLEIREILRIHTPLETDQKHNPYN